LKGMSKSSRDISMMLPTTIRLICIFEPPTGFADYVGQNYSNGASTHKAIFKVKIPVFALPPPLDEGANNEKKNWDEKLMELSSMNTSLNQT